MNNAPETDATLEGKLSQNPEKIAYYLEDPYYYESLTDLKVLLTPEEFALFINKVASIILKPEAFISGKAKRVLEFYLGHGFKPISFRTKTLDRHMIRALWRFQLNAATRDRLQLLDEWAALSDVVYVVLCNVSDNGELPASTVVTNLRGHSNPLKHRPGDLRMLLGQEITMINYLHSADEPADVIRDMGVMLAASEIRAVVRDIISAQDCSLDLADELQRLCAKQNTTDLAVARIIEVIAQRLSRPELVSILAEKTASTASIKDLEAFCEREGIQLTQVERVILLAKQCRLVRSATSSKIRSVLSK